MTVEAPQYVDLAGLIDLVQHEAIVLVPYEDGEYKTGPRKGQKKYSIAMGSQTPEVRADDPPITIPQAFERLRVDVDARCVDVNRRLKVSITQHQFNAIHSLYYQGGSEALNYVADLYNAGKPMAAILAHAKYRYNKGEPSEGLAARRADEIAVARRGAYGDQTIIRVYDADPKTTKPRLVSVAEVFPAIEETGL